MLRPTHLARALLVLVLVASVHAAGCDRTLDGRDAAGDGGEEGAGGAAPDTWRMPDCAALATVDGIPVFDVPRFFRDVAALEDPNVLLAAGYTLERSTDGGCSWEVLDEADFGEDYGGIVPRAGGGAYLVGGSRALARVDGTSVTGLSVPPPAPEGADGPTTIVVDPSDGDHLLAFRADAMLFRSEDGATTWSLVGPTPQGARFGATIHPRDRDDVVVLDALGTARSIDGGLTWSRATFLADGAPVESPRGRLVRSTVDPDVLQLIGGGPDTPEDTDFPPRGVYRSTDGGTTFTWEGEHAGGRVLASSAGSDAWWVATAQYDGGYSSRGIELAHVVDGVERDRVAIPAASEVLTLSPAGALYVARASTAE